MGRGCAASSPPISEATVDAHRFDPTILREYDIRGIVGETLSSADARAIGRAYAVMLAEAGGSRVAAGYDGRLTSPELEAALVDGLVTEGVDVVRIGRGPTPMLYYAAATLAVDGGVMVTGSHNPPDYNGFKFVFQGKSFYGAAIQRLGETALGLGAPRARRGQVAEHAIRDDYVQRVARDYDGVRDPDRRVGRRKRRHRRGAPGADRAPTRTAHPAECDDRRHVSGASSRPDSPREPPPAATGGVSANAAISASPSTAMAIGSASSTGAGGSCGAIS